MLKVSLFFLLGLLLLNGCALIDLPKKSLAGEGRYSLSGDFDGDNKTDEASLRFKTSQEGVLSAELSLSGTQKITVLQHPNDVVLSLAQPGSYQRLCQKEEAACKGSKKAFTLTSDAIRVTYPEKSSRLYVWNGGQFEEIFLTD